MGTGLGTATTHCLPLYLELVYLELVYLELADAAFGCVVAQGHGFVVEQMPDLGPVLVEAFGQDEPLGWAAC
jgi:hypothetical protein